MKIVYLLVIFSMASGCSSHKATVSKGTEAIEEKWLWEWIASWDSISKNVFDLAPAIAPEILFYDDEYMYSNSRISISKGHRFKGPTLYGEKITWKKQRHNDTLKLPNGAKASLQLMTFGAPLDNGSFFVMPAPSYWKKVGLRNEIVAVDKMLNGIFVHEFAHTRQMKSIIENVVQFEKKGSYEHPVNDDILQNYFQKDSVYSHLFRQEVDCLFQSLSIKNRVLFIKEVKKCVNSFERRQSNYLKPVSNDFAEIDNTFLTMEGIGQYAMLMYYLSLKEENLDFEQAIAAVRHNRKWWSQDEGLALILVYEKVIGQIDWDRLFAIENKTIVDLLKKELDAL